MQDECECKQPCNENAFETAYSAAAWPALNFEFGDDCPTRSANDSDDTDVAACAEYYRLVFPHYCIPITGVNIADRTQLILKFTMNS